MSPPCARRGLRRACAVALALVLTGTLGRTASAHRLDEYLQAARISLSRDAVRLDLSLAPGAAVAPGIIATLDVDRDGNISPPEANTYALSALQAMTLTLDGQPLSLRLVATDPVTPASLLAGEGFLRVRAEARVETPTQVGPHDLRFENTFAPGSSVYLGNAMLPEDRAIAINGQDHGTNQSTLTIRYEVRAEESVGRFWVWLLATAAVIGTGFLMVPRIARSRRTSHAVASEASEKKGSLDEPVAASGDHRERSRDNQRTPD